MCMAIKKRSWHTFAKPAHCKINFQLIGHTPGVGEKAIRPRAANYTTLRFIVSAYTVREPKWAHSLTRLLV